MTLTQLTKVEVEPKTIVECEACSSDIECSWTNELKYSGQCKVCGSIVLFISERDVLNYTLIRL